MLTVRLTSSPTKQTTLNYSYLVNSLSSSNSKRLRSLSHKELYLKMDKLTNFQMCPRISIWGSVCLSIHPSVCFEFFFWNCGNWVETAQNYWKSRYMDPWLQITCKYPVKNMQYTCKQIPCNQIWLISLCNFIFVSSFTTNLFEQKLYKMDTSKEVHVCNEADNAWKRCPDCNKFTLYLKKLYTYWPFVTITH